MTSDTVQTIYSTCSDCMFDNILYDIGMNTFRPVRCVCVWGGGGDCILANLYFEAYNMFLLNDFPLLMDIKRCGWKAMHFCESEL